MTDKEKEAIERISFEIAKLDFETLKQRNVSIILNDDLKTVLNLVQSQQEEIKNQREIIVRHIKKKIELEEEIEKKDNIIDKMAEQLFYWQDDKLPLGYSIKEVKEYFINKVEKENK